MNVCPFCATKEAPTTSHVIESSKDAHTVHVTCEKCGQSVLVLIRVSQLGVHCVGIITDLKVEDAGVLLHSSVVNVDDVFSTHEALNREDFLEGVREGLTVSGVASEHGTSR